MNKKKTSRVVWLRRLTQAAFLLLFLYLFLVTAYYPINRVGGPVTFFFEINPLVWLASLLASRALETALLLSLLTLGVTSLFGRWFCGWVCPFGTLHHFFTSLRGTRLKAKLEAGDFSRWQRVKYYVLAGFLAGALLGVNAVGWLDPISFLYRALATAVYPALNSGTVSVFSWVYEKDPGLGPARVTSVTEPVYEFLREYFLAVEQPFFYGGILIGALFFGVLALNFFRARFWCRYICPLGALLGLVGRNPLVKLKINSSECNDCRLCLADCQGGASPASAAGWKPPECFFCWNCHSECPSGSVAFGWKPSLRVARQQQLDLNRRAMLGAGVLGIGGALVLRAHPHFSREVFHPELVRPPGSLSEEEFLARCVRCGECMKVCPTNAVQAALLEVGLEGLWTPVLKMNVGYCEYECTLCMQVCPTGAIRETSLEEKQEIRIGTAFFDKDRCLPYSFHRSCIVCEEHCPTPTKAIWFEDVEIVNRQGEKTMLKQPHVDPELCTGCGICVTKCPVEDRPAVYVTSAGETRHPDNRFLLEDPFASPYR